MPKVKIVFGETASKMHESGLPDDKVKEWGSIEEYSFQTQNEMDAFMLGLEATYGWLGWTEYCPDNLQSDEEEE